MSSFTCMTQVLKIAACLWSCAAEDSEPWLGRWSPLMRRDAGSSALLEHSRDLDTVPEPPDLSLHFAHEELVTCDMEEADAFWQTHPFRRNAEKMQTQLAAMRGLREIKRIFATQSLPLIVVGDLLLGWRRGCLASATAATVSVATFGPWLQELGLNTLEKAFRTHGLELDTSRCPHGPLMAGCRLSGHLRRSDGSLTTLQLGVLLSPPPAMVGRRPGFFPRCAAGCGSTCERCRLAWPQPSKVNPDRFYACPLPLADFKLATWMNETFWIPANLETYLAVDHGEQWPEPAKSSGVSKLSCLPSQSSGLSFSPYRSFISSLPGRSEVMRLQKAVEKRHGDRMARAAEAEKELWYEFFHDRSATWLLAPKKTSSQSPVAQVAAAPVPPNVFLRVFGVLLTLVALKIFAGALFRRGAKMGPLPGWMAAVGTVEVVLLVSYTLMFCGRILLQRHASLRLHHAASNALAAAAVQAVVAGLLASRRLARSNLRKMLMTCPSQTPIFEHWPVWWWIFLAGALHSLSLWLSFLSLASLDPVSYTLLWNSQAFLLPLALAPSRRHLTVAAAAAPAAAVAVGYGAGAAAAVGQVVTAAVAEVVMAVAQPAAPIDVLQACQSAQGLLVLLVILWLCGDPFPAVPYWKSFLESESMPACVTCLCLLQLGKPYLQRKVPSSWFALAPVLSMLAMLALIQGPAASPWYLIQVGFSLTAATLHAVDMAQKQKPQPRLEAVKENRSCTLRRPPTPAPPVAPVKRPPLPPAPRKLSSSNSEVGSTTASNSHSEHGESDSDMPRATAI